MTSPISRDYARRPELIGDMAHVQWMKRPTFSAINRIREQKHSEFKKPYREDDHVPMEHWADYPFPVYTFPPFPNFPGPIPDDPSSPWILHPGEEEEEGPGVGCPPTCYCHPGNPQTIAAGGTAMLNVTACAPPNEMTVTIHQDNYFNVRSQPAFIRGSGAQWVFTIEAEDDACGVCTLIISCSDGSGTMCYLRCDNGVWVPKGTGVCEMSGRGTTPDGGASFTYIVGYRKQAQSVFKCDTCNDTCANCWPDGACNCCNPGTPDDCGIVACDPCISYYAPWSDFLVPYIDYAGPKCNTYRTTGLAYYEWGCP